MVKKAVIRSFLALVALLVVLPVHADNIVADPNFTGPSAWTILENWGEITSAGSYSYNGLGAMYTPCVGGFECYFYQDLSTTPGDTYELTYYETQNDPFGPAGIEALWNGVVVQQQLYGSGGGDPVPPNFEFFDVTGLVATGTSTVLEFSGYQNPAEIWVSDVSVVDVSSEQTGVPEPGSLLLLSTGLLGVGRIVRRKFAR